MGGNGGSGKVRWKVGLRRRRRMCGRLNDIFVRMEQADYMLWRLSVSCGLAGGA